MGEPAIIVRGLHKNFGAKEAVAGINLEIAAGSLAGLVGPNGAGKTTTLSMMTGLLRPDLGQVLINGLDVWRDPPAAKAVIGVVPAEVRLFERLSGEELLEYAGRLRGLPAVEARSRAGQLLDVLDLAGDAKRLVADYSTGMRKKAALGCALIHNPSALFLDEPLEGVDPVSADVIRRLLTRYTGSGSTVLFSSHVMETGRAGLRPRLDHRQGPDRGHRHHRRGAGRQDPAAGVHRPGRRRRAGRGGTVMARILVQLKLRLLLERAALVRAGQGLVHCQHDLRRGGRDRRLRAAWPHCAARQRIGWTWPRSCSPSSRSAGWYCRCWPSGSTAPLTRPRWPSTRCAPGSWPWACWPPRAHRRVAAGQPDRPARGDRRAGQRSFRRGHRGAGRRAAAGAVLHHPGPVRDHRPWPGCCARAAASDLAVLLVIPIFVLYEIFTQVVPKAAASGKLTASSFAGVDRLDALDAARAGRARDPGCLHRAPRDSAAAPRAAGRRHRRARLALDQVSRPGPGDRRHVAREPRRCAATRCRSPGSACAEP